MIKDLKGREVVKGDIVDRIHFDWEENNYCIVRGIFKGMCPYEKLPIIRDVDEEWDNTANTLVYEEKEQFVDTALNEYERTDTSSWWPVVHRTNLFLLNPYWQDFKQQVSSNKS
jgi:hypothetical protein